MAVDEAIKVAVLMASRHVKFKSDAIIIANRSHLYKFFTNLCAYEKSTNHSAAMASTWMRRVTSIFMP